MLWGEKSDGRPRCSEDHRSCGGRSLMVDPDAEDHGCCGGRSLMVDPDALMTTGLVGGEKSDGGSRC